VGSGLILLLIVGAWLAVLVPMALRSHEVRTSATAERVQEARRVLSRRGPRSAGAVRTVEPITSRRLPVPGPAVPRPPGRPTSRRVSAAGRPRRGIAVRSLAGWPPLRGAPGRRASRPVGAAARRRRQVVVVLAVLAVLTLLGALVGPAWLLWVHVALDLLLVAYLGAIASTADRRAGRSAREPVRSAGVPKSVGGAAEPVAHGPAVSRPPGSRPVRGAPVLTAQQQADRVAARAEARAERARLAFVRERAERARRVVSPHHVAGIPNRMPARPAARAVQMEIPDVAVRPARGAQGEPWQPVPVPVPTYVTAPQAPQPPAPVPSRPPTHEYARGHAEEHVDQVELRRVRRASGDW